MAYSRKLIHFATKANFEAQLEAKNILDTSICFIKDAKQIWTHGQYYSCPYTQEEINQLFVGSKILLTDYIEIPSPINILATDTVNEAFSKIEEYLSTLDELNAVLVDTGDVAEDPTFNDYISPEEFHTTLMEYATRMELDQKQDKNLYFNNVSASNWVADTTYEDYGYRCDLTCNGVTSDMYAEVIFELEQATSGEYAPICETKDNIVSIWSSSNTTITIPTIIIEL